jgi:hypothetical protein
MNVKDLEIAQDLSQEERAVRGGNSSHVGGLNQFVVGNLGGNSFASPTTVVGINDPTVVQLDTTSITKDISKATDVLGSLGTLIKQ